jgi:hypothetical protein
VALQEAVDRLVAGLSAQHPGEGRGGAEAVVPAPAAASGGGGGGGLGGAEGDVVEDEEATRKAAAVKARDDALAALERAEALLSSVTGEPVRKWVREEEEDVGGGGGGGGSGGSGGGGGRRGRRGRCTLNILVAVWKFWFCICSANGCHT